MAEIDRATTPNERSLEEKNRFTTKEVDEARKRLIRDVFDFRNDGRLKRRDTVRQLMGALTAARQAGYGWEEIAALLAEGGVTLKAGTLKQYFFDLREEITADDREEANTYIDTRKQLSVDQRRIERSEAVREARAKVGGQAREGNRRNPAAAPGSAPASSSRPEPPAPATPPPSSSNADPGSLANPDTPGQGIGPLLSDLEKKASTVKQPTPLPDDVILSPDGRVYFTTGEPFNLLLNSRQIHLLKTTKHLVAPSSGSSSRTAGSFVPMREI